MLEEAEADALAYFDIPYEYHVRLRTNNVQERANRELELRNRAVQAFPGGKSPIILMGAVFAEMDEEWVGRCWFDGDSIGRAVEGVEANAPGRAGRIIALVVAGNRFPAGRRRDMGWNDGILGDSRFLGQPTATLENRALHQLVTLPQRKRDRPILRSMHKWNQAGTAQV